MTMIDVRKQEDHYHHRRSWLETDWHFSFGEYRDPNNMNFGPLRVVNNDRVDGGGGFPTHPHDNMEIITWIIRGTLAHEDATGARETVGRNGVQTMSAGTGITHSEHNASDTEELHLLQIWIEPSEQDVDPRYQDQTYSEDDMHGQWVPIASGRNERAGTPIEQDATIYVRHAKSGEQFSYETESDRRLYFVDILGELNLNEESLAEGDAARIRQEQELEFESITDTEVLMIDLP